MVLYKMVINPWPDAHKLSGNVMYDPIPKKMMTMVLVIAPNAHA